MVKRLVLTMVAGLVLGVSACAAPGSLHRTAQMPGQPEAIQAAAFTRDTVLVKVSSNGCTDRDDIKPFITKLRSRTVMSLRRLDEDGCDSGSDRSLLLQFSFDELGLEPGTHVELDSPYLQPSNIK